MLDGSVLVVAKTSPLEAKTEQWRERDGVSIARVLRKIRDRYKRFRIVVLINGKPIAPARFGETRAYAGDLVNVIVNPTWSGSPIKQLAGFGLGAGSLAALWLLGRNGKGNKATSALATNTIAPPPEQPPDPPNKPIDNYGGPGDTVMPALMGIENAFNNWGPWPVIYGKNIPVTPVKVASEYFLTEGDKQWMYVVLTCGVGQLDMTNFMLGERSLDDLVAAGLAEYEVRYGSPDDYDTPLTLYTRDVDQVNVGEELAYNVLKQATGGQEANELIVDFVFPNGLFRYDTPNYTIDFQGITTSPISYSPANPYSAQTCEFTIEYRLHGSSDAWTSVNFSVTGNTPAQKLASWKTTVATPGVYDVRITRTTSDAVTYADEPVPGTLVYHHVYTPTQNVTWTALKSVQSAAPLNIMKDSQGNDIPITLIALRVQASEITNGTLSNLKVTCSRYLRTYDGEEWTDPVVTDNPAWAFADVFTGYINDSRLGLELIDASTLKDWADFCEEKGLGYTRPITTFTTIEELAEEIARHGRASSNQVDGVWTVVVDKPRSTMVQIFTPALCRNFEWTAEWPQYPDGVKIKFRNPDADWEVDERTVFADGYTENNSSNFETVDMLGLTSATAAWKLGRYFLAAAEQRPIKYEFDTDRQNLCCKRGDLVGLNYDASYDGLGKGELVASVTDDGVDITSITLDNPVVMEAGQTYGILIRLEDHTFVTKEVNTVEGEQYTLTFAEPIPLTDPVLPTRGMAVGFGYLGQEVTQCIISSIQHLDDFNSRITLVEYSPNIFNADSGAIPAYTPNVNRRHEAALPVIDPPVLLGALSNEDAIQVTGSQYISRIQLSLAAPTSSGVGFVQTQYRITGTEDWISNYQGPVSSTVFITNVRDLESYDVRIRFQSNTHPGLASEWTTLMGHTVVGQSSLPPDVPVFERQGNIAFLKYDGEAEVAVPIDHDGFEYRWAQGSTADEWDNMFVLAISKATTVSLATLPPGDLVLAVKAVDRSGNRSQNAAFIYTNLEGSLIENQYLETSESPAWSGTKTNFTQVGNELWADQSADLFWGTSGSPHYNPNSSAAYYGVGYLTARYEWSYIPPADLAKPYRIHVKITDDGTPSGASLIDCDIFFVEYQRNSQARFYKEDGASDFYGSASDPFFPADASTNVWLPMPQEGLDGAREEYRFRITCLASSARRPKLLEGIGTLVDVADITESGTLVCNAVTGSEVTLTKSYREIRGVQVTLQRDAVNYPDARSADAEWSTDPTEPITIRVYDLSGNVVAGKVTYDIKGV